MGVAAAVPRPQAKPVFRPEAGPRRRIAFVCVGNSCRSQMAEAWVRHLARSPQGGLEVEAVSAGIFPLGFITPETLQVMEEKEVSLEGQESKGLEDIDWKLVEVLVNMTGLPGRSVVPGFLGKRMEWRVPDPYGQPLRTYRKVRDQLERKVERLLADLKKSSPGGTAAPAS
ncbi:MAG: arsenate reductase ArsC [Acidobacteria bacterium]|nr:arsenate reductase ArsC [Acidobacteriota bacterium]